MNLNNVLSNIQSWITNILFSVSLHIRRTICKKWGHKLHTHKPSKWSNPVRVAHAIQGAILFGYSKDIYEKHKDDRLVVCNRCGDWEIVKKGDKSTRFSTDV